jgi:transcriptional regulator with PAS, ATPase and Fis domain
LYTERGDPEPINLQLKQHLENTFPGHKVKLAEAHISDLYDNQEIKAVVLDMLKPYQDYQIDVLTSTGTTPMRTTWTLIYLDPSNDFKLTLLQSLDKVMGGGKEQIREINIDQSIIAGRIEATIKKEATEKPVAFTPESLAEVYQRARQIALVSDNKLWTLIQGPSGSGKELLARFLHENSATHAKKFIPLNCASLSNDLLESRLFGHRKGAFTGADEDRPGAFEDADGGWLFLDEVGDMSAYMQQALLRVLQERKVQRVGETKERSVNVRILAATNRDLWSECEVGRFRWDLYYRLAATELFLPALADWQAKDKDALIDFLIKKRAAILKERKLRLSKKLREWIRMHRFPGNVRELEQLIVHLYIFAPEKSKTADMDALPVRYKKRTAFSHDSREQAKRAHAQRIFLRSNNNLSLAAKKLGISRQTLMKYVKGN